MLASSLPHRIVIDTLTDVQDNITGEITQSWNEYVSTWAKVTPFSNKDMLNAQAKFTLSKMRCVIRYNQTTKGITSNMRVRWREKYYRIEGEPYADNVKGVDWLTLNLSTGEKSWQQ